MHVDKHHVLRQLYSVSVDFQQFEGSFSSIKEDLTEWFHVERRLIKPAYVYSRDFTGINSGESYDTE